VPIKVIVELQAKPGRRDELKGLLESMVATNGPSQRGFLGSTRYEVLDNPDMLIEIAEWESTEARVAHMQEARKPRKQAKTVAEGCDQLPIGVVRSSRCGVGGRHRRGVRMPASSG